MPQRDSTDGRQLCACPSSRGPDCPTGGGQRIRRLDGRLARPRLVGLPGDRSAAVRVGASDRVGDRSAARRDDRADDHRRHRLRAVPARAPGGGELGGRAIASGVLAGDRVAGIRQTGLGRGLREHPSPMGLGLDRDRRASSDRLIPLGARVVPRPGRRTAVPVPRLSPGARPGVRHGAGCPRPYGPTAATGGPHPPRGHRDRPLRPRAGLRVLAADGVNGPGLCADRLLHADGQRGVRRRQSRDRCDAHLQRRRGRRDVPRPAVGDPRPPRA